MRFSYLTAILCGLKAINFSALKISFLKPMPWHHEAVLAAANSCGFQGYIGERDFSHVRGSLHPISGKRRPEGRPEGILCVFPALCLGRWNCFDFLSCSIWFASYQSRVISRALETQTSFFTLGFKIILSAAGIQLASGKDGVEFHQRKTVKTILWSLNRIFDMSK